MVQATFLTEIRGKEQRTYLLSQQDQLELQQDSSNNQQRSSSFLTGLKGKRLLRYDLHMHRALARDGVSKRLPGTGALQKCWCLYEHCSGGALYGRSCMQASRCQKNTYRHSHQTALTALGSPSAHHRLDGIFNEVQVVHAGFVLPKGYPATVTLDYLPFQLWAVPAHITGWMGTSLATSSLLKAVGAANSAEGAAAAGAAIKWITKDGIGAAGRSVVRST